MLIPLTGLQPISSRVLAFDDAGEISPIKDTSPGKTPLQHERFTLRGDIVVVNAHICFYLLFQKLLVIFRRFAVLLTMMKAMPIRVILIRVCLTSDCETVVKCQLALLSTASKRSLSVSLSL